MYRLILHTCIFLCALSHVFGQVPFDCNGRSYRVLAADGGTYFQEIIQNEFDQTISFIDLHFYPDIEINAIGYHPSQNVIYGVLQKPPYRLCRIDAQYNLDVLQELPLSSDLVFVSGDISPDEQYLVLFGFGDTRNENIFALVDVESGTYETEIIPLQTTNIDETYIYCADIAFHPTTGKLFGFDFRYDRLVTLDIPNRLIDNTRYPVSRFVKGNMPSIFFDAKGDLYGIGTTTQDSSTDRTYYTFDLQSGEGRILEERGQERNQDACSCPYKINVLNDVRSRENAPCTELAFEITIINKSDIDQFDLVLRDTFPNEVTIKDIGALPFEGTIGSSVGSNILTIENMNIPVGIYSFEIILDIDENVRSGNYNNQVFLSGISVDDLELESVRSDDPKTPISGDATAFSINALTPPFIDEFFGICQGGITTLNTGIYAAQSYLWSTGETSESITVSEAGNYSVTITTDCDQTMGTAIVNMDEIDLELGVDFTIESGQSVILHPEYTSLSRIKSFHWTSSGSDHLDCPSCENPLIRPYTSTEVQLVIENNSGCQSTDQVLLNVTDIEYYAANIFSPNNDGINDSFYLQGNLEYDISRFRIFDRWGRLIFQNSNLKANNSSEGWRGICNGQDCNPGVYTWTALIRRKNGEQDIIAGDITLVR